MMPSRGHGAAVLSLCLQAGWILSGAALFIFRRGIDPVLLALLVAPALFYAVLCRLATIKAVDLEKKIVPRFREGPLRVFVIMGFILLFIIFYALFLHPVVWWFLSHDGHADLVAGFGAFMINFVIVQAVIAAFLRPDLVASLKAFRL